MTDTKQAVEMPEEIWAENELYKKMQCIGARPYDVSEEYGLPEGCTKYLRADLAETVPTAVTVNELMSTKLKEGLIRVKGNPFITDRDNDIINFVLHELSDYKNGIRIVP